MYILTKKYYFYSFDPFIWLTPGPFGSFEFRIDPKGPKSYIPRSVTTLSVAVSLSSINCHFPDLKFWNDLQNVKAMKIKNWKWFLPKRIALASACICWHRVRTVNEYCDMSFRIVIKWPFVHDCAAKSSVMRDGRRWQYILSRSSRGSLKSKHVPCRIIEIAGCRELDVARASTVVRKITDMLRILHILVYSSTCLLGCWPP